MATQAKIKRLKASIENGKHPMQQSLHKRQKRAQKVADKVIVLAHETEK
jgi:anti-sigma28 factor (negative regulator of flagellin synthesis)